MHSFAIDGIGYIALVLNLFSMAVKGEYRLRFISAIANTMYIGYGILINAYPIIVGCTVAVCLHLYRLKTLKQTQK